MARVIAGMTMSLDGFVADVDGSAAALYPGLALPETRLGEAHGGSPAPPGYQPVAYGMGDEYPTTLRGWLLHLQCVVELE